MSILICPTCGARIDLFGSGGGKKQAEEMNVRFLGSLPISLEARKLGDEGKPVILEKREARISMAIMDIITGIENMFSSMKAKKTGSE